MPNILVIEKVAGAIQETFKFLSNWLSGKHARKLQYRVEAAMSYVHVDERHGEYKDISEKEARKWKVHFAKRIFDE